MNVTRLEPVEPIVLDQGRVAELTLRFGAVGFEEVLNNAMEDLAILLTRHQRAFDQGRFVELARYSVMLAELADQVGLTRLAQIARHNAAMASCDHGATIAALVARLQRHGHLSLFADWDSEGCKI